MNTCQHCHVEILTTNKYCSNECKWAARRKETSPCITCGNPVPHRAHNGVKRKYCSQDCYFATRRRTYEEQTKGQRRCCSCKQLLDVSEFFGTARLCRKCSVKKSSNRVRDNKQRLVEFLGGQCVVCGYNRYVGAMHFHHTEPNLKVIPWNKIRSANWDTLKAWALGEKVVLHCANCHIELHGIAEGSYTPPDQ